MRMNIKNETRPSEYLQGKRLKTTMRLMDCIKTGRRRIGVSGAAIAALFGCAGLLQAQPRVAIATVESASLPDLLELSGTLTAERSAGLSPRVDGLVEDVRVDAGDSVRAGQIVLTLDATLAEAALQRAQAAAAQARAARDEAKRRADEADRLVADKHLPQTELATRKAALAEAEAALAAAQAAEREQAELVQRHVLPAPFDGVITAKHVEAGEWVARADAVLDLVDLGDIRLEVQAPQERFSAITPETAVDLVPDTSPDRVLEARVAARVPVGGDARTFLVRIVAEAADVSLFPGTSATARFHLPSTRGETVQVPRDALLRHPDGGYSVFVTEQTDAGFVARRRPVRLGRDAGNRVEVLSGVRHGESIVIRGNEALRDGDTVTIADPPQ